MISSVPTENGGEEMQANIEVKGNFKLGHVEVIGDGLPFILKLDKGYIRVAYAKSEQGEKIALLGSSNIESKPTKRGCYKRANGEEITPILGIVMDNIETAKMFEKLFKYIVKSMKEEE